MSEYNRNVSSNGRGQIAPSQVVPGTSSQQMWQVLNFHEERFKQLTQYLSDPNSSHNTKQSGKTEFNMIMQQLEHLKARVSTLEAEKEQLKYPSNVTLSIEEEN
jgi:cell shape-determining protein MreC